MRRLKVTEVTRVLRTETENTATELEAARYKPPRWHGKKEHATRAGGFVSVRACYDWMLIEVKPLRAESRDQGLKQQG